MGAGPTHHELARAFWAARAARLMNRAEGATRPRSNPLRPAGRPRARRAASRGPQLRVGPHALGSETGAVSVERVAVRTMSSAPRSI